MITGFVKERTQNFPPYALPDKIHLTYKGDFIMSINGENIRNIAVVGHSGEGKTTLVEAMLLAAGATDRMGKVTDGTTVSDYDVHEKAKKMSIYASCSHLMWKDV